MKDSAHNKTITININGTGYEWSEKFISYQQLIDLSGIASETDYTVTYKDGHKEEQLTPASPLLKVKKGMEFDVDGTHNS